MRCGAKGAAWVPVQGREGGDGAAMSALLWCVPRASFASYTGHPTEPGTQLSLFAFSLDDTQQVHHKYSGMKQCDLFPLCHLPANVQMAEFRGLSRLTHLSPLDNCRERAVLSTVQVVSEILASSPRGMVFP